MSKYVWGYDEAHGDMLIVLRCEVMQDGTIRVVEMWTDVDAERVLEGLASAGLPVTSSPLL